jgi:hypothetical protein
MANNPYVNKVISNNQTLIDLTSDTVTPADVRTGVSFHDLTGAALVGTMVNGKVVQTVEPASVPVAWSNAYLDIETVCYDHSTNEAVVYAWHRWVGNTDSLDPKDYEFGSATPAYSVPANVIFKAPDGHRISSGEVSSTRRAATAAEAASWAVSALTSGAQTTLVDVDSGYHRVTSDDSSDHVYGLTCKDTGAYDIDYTLSTETIAAWTGTIPGGTYGSETLASVKITGVTGTPSEYGPGYLVTYTDNTSETFVAASSDVADGGSY